MKVNIHPQALVESSDIGEGTSIWAFAHVMQNVRIGSGCNIGDHTFLESGASVGNQVTIKNQVCIWEGITIEDGVLIGPRVTFTNDRYPRSPRMPEAQQRYTVRENWLCRTVVRWGCSIGAGAVICPGLELGYYSVIAAGAVVSRNVPAFSLVRGNPARFAGNMCSCGQPLKGPWESTQCGQCGETGCSRQERLNSRLSLASHVESTSGFKQHS
ncbi:MAG: N-acetyltransferase [Pirellulaceae bacterium]|nr:N-acetyltransferase [Pirellulaceae bacterium]